MSNKPPIKIALLGLGNVGTGVLNILKENADLIKERTGHPVEIKSILVRNPESHKEKQLGNITLTTNPEDILNDPEIEIIAELIGGENPALDLITKSLNAGKHIITANKEVIAKHKTKLFDTAKENNVDLYFEASVGGGIPIIRAYKVGYAANKIESIVGILNGTTNYILTQIKETGRPFADILKEAQDKGFAEADPTSDVSGLDAAYKTIILAAVAFKADITIDDIAFQGIENIDVKDVNYAEELGYTIKLIAKANQKDEQYSFSVFPTLIPNTHPLASVRNEYNAIFTIGNALGESMITGKGAGALPTGSAVVSDIIDCIFDTHSEKPSRRNLEVALTKITPTPADEILSKHYLRIQVKDNPGVLENVSKTLTQNKISILKIVQKDAEPDTAELAIITHETSEKNIQKTLKELKSLPNHIATPTHLHVN